MQSLKDKFGALEKDKGKLSSELAEQKAKRVKHEAEYAAMQVEAEELKHAIEDAKFTSDKKRDDADR